jgi:hypothetical protein
MHFQHLKFNLMTISRSNYQQKMHFQYFSHGHDCVLHPFCVSRESPSLGQVLKPPNLGVLHDLVRVWFPVLQIIEQLLQLLHKLQAASTKIFVVCK